MFGWRRRSEGFEWKEYVRTTVLVRRADRQRKIDDARMEMLAKVKDTRDRGVEAGRAGVDAVSHHASSFLTSAGRALWHALASTAEWLMSSARAATVKILDRLPDRPNVSWPNVSLPHLVRASPPGTPQTKRLMPDIAWRLPFSPRLIGGSALAVALIFIGGPMLQDSGDVTAARFVPATTSKVTIDTSGEPAHDSLSGRATAVSGDLLRINGTLVRLAGIEQPEAKHPCQKANGRRWNCSAGARQALDKIVRGNAVACTASGQDSDGRTLAACRIDGADVAEALVKGGHVFAAPGWLASYSSAEGEARDAKRGLWQSDTIRPQDWRKQVWEEAKRAAPEGCPIKGYMRASDRLYAMPWAQGYDGAKVRTIKGDRWFCSEDEARAAGFKAVSRS